MNLRKLFALERPQGRSHSPLGDLAAWEEGNPHRLASEVHGSAQWAYVTDLVRAGMFDGSCEDAPGIPLAIASYSDMRGTQVGGIVRWPHEGHRVIVGSTGSGKFTCGFAPALLSRSEQSAIVIDPKDGEAMGKTALFRAQWSLVGVLTPERTYDEFAADGFGHVYLSLNPLDALQGSESAIVLAAKRLGDALIIRVRADQAFWDDVAHRWLVATLIYVATAPEESERTLMRVQQIIAEGWPERILYNMLHFPVGAGVVQRAASEIDQNQQAGGEGSRLYMDVRANLLNAFQFLDVPGVRESLGESNFDPAMLRTHAAPCTVYIVVSAQNVDVYARWLRLVYSSLVDLVARAQGREVAVYVDEFAALKRFDRVVQDLATLRGFGFRLHLALQDLSQLQDLYGHGWQSIVGNCAIRQVLGVNDVFTAEYVERLLGSTTVEKPYAHHVKPWGHEGPGFWKSELVGRPLLSAAEVTNMPRDEQVIFIDGLPRPLRARKAHYFAFEPWAGRATPRGGQL